MHQSKRFDTFFGLACYGYDNYFTHDNKVSAPLLTATRPPAA
jgi:hypothetical protein